MSLRNDGLKWLQLKHGSPVGPVHVSQCYSEDSAWPKRPVWWFEFSETRLTEDTDCCIHFLCQQVDALPPFTYLRVPVAWLRDRRDELYIRQDGDSLIVSIYLSAEDVTLFHEIRGTGRLDFSKFVQ